MVDAPVNISERNRQQVYIKTPDQKRPDANILSLILKILECTTEEYIQKP